MSPGRRLAVIASVVVGATLVAAIAVMDSPPEQREQRLDARRVQDLQHLESAIAVYHAGHKALPGDLATLRAEMPGWNLAPGDPASGVPYGYEVSGARSYRLCAEFTTDTAAADTPHGPEGDAWKHGAGRQCFNREVANRPGP